MELKKGYLICFEGVEGSGKSTQAKLLYNFVKKKITKKVILTREPGGTVVGEKIRNLILKKKLKIHKITELFLLFAARNEHVVNKIEPFLKKKYLVICDRFLLSTLAYQHFLHNIEDKFILLLQNKIYKKIYSDINFIFDINRKVSRSRILSRNKKINKYDQVSLREFNKVKKGFKILSKTIKHCYFINTKKDINQIHEQLQKILVKKINARY